MSPQSRLLQYAVLHELISDISSRYKVQYVVGHDEVAPGRKKDPGTEFQWERLREGPFTERHLKVGRRRLVEQVAKLQRIR